MAPSTPLRPAERSLFSFLGPLVISEKWSTGSAPAVGRAGESEAMAGVNGIGAALVDQGRGCIGAQVTRISREITKMDIFEKR